jgi:hypothetical protein
MLSRQVLGQVADAEEAVREPEHERRSPERDPGAEPREQAEAEAAVPELLHDRYDHGEDDQVEGELHRSRTVPEHRYALVGVGSFKMAGAAIVPFGRQIVKLEELGQPPPDASAIGG